jgi:hypothetical protein
MAYERTLKYKFEMIKKRQRNNLSPEELRKMYSELNKIALEEGYYGVVIDTYIILNDKNNIKKIGEECFHKGMFDNALRAFKYLDDKSAILRIIRAVDNGQDNDLNDNPYEILCDYLSNITKIELDFEFEKWASNKGIEDAYSHIFGPVINMAYHISGDYDIGIGIARGGLSTAYIFELFELPIKVVQSHKKGEETTFEWVTKTNQKGLEEKLLEDLEGKKVVVFDKDVRSGITTKRVLKEIQKYAPKSIDLVLNLDPVDSESKIGTIASNIPNGYNAIYYPKDFDCQSFDEAVKYLELKLGI